VKTKIHAVVLLLPVLATTANGQVTRDHSQQELIAFQIRQVVSCGKSSRKLFVRRDPSGKTYCLSDTVIVDESNVIEAHDGRSSGKVEVSFSVTFNREGARKLQAFSKRYTRKPIGVLVDGELVAVSKVFEELSEEIRIQGDHFDPAEVAEWVDRFNKVQTKSPKPNRT
jgi:preprotein translocase subunit SecD